MLKEESLSWLSLSYVILAIRDPEAVLSRATLIFFYGKKVCPGHSPLLPDVTYGWSVASANFCIDVMALNVHIGSSVSVSPDSLCLVLPQYCEYRYWLSPPQQLAQIQDHCAAVTVCWQKSGQKQSPLRRGLLTTRPLFVVIFQKVGTTALLFRLYLSERQLIHKGVPADVSIYLADLYDGNCDLFFDFLATWRYSLWNRIDKRDLLALRHL